MRRLSRHAVLLRRTLAHALQDDVFNIAQSAAYSAIVALFPALIVFAALVPLLPDTAPIRYELADVAARILPTDVMPLLESYFSPAQEAFTSTRALIFGAVLSTLGAAGVISTFMEGLRRAYSLPPNCWSFWRRRRRALLLVPLSLLPLASASLLVLFGHVLANAFIDHAATPRSAGMVALVFTLRWLIALTASAGLIALLYKLGTPLRPRWRAILPGALLATALWFASTVIFGWYVTRFANYTRVYGSLGAGIALLFWLYLASLSVLFGAEFNGQLLALAQDTHPPSAPETMPSPL